MRRLFAHIGMTFDGYVDDLEGAPVFRFQDEEFQHYLDGMLESIDGMVLGHTAYEQLAAYWPVAGDEAPPVQVARMRELPKYVLAREPLRASWAGAHPLGADPVQALAHLKAAPGRGLALFAGASAVRAALGFGVLDELRVVIQPAIACGRTRLFEGDYPDRELRLIDMRAFPSGMLLVRYEVVRG